MASPGSRHSRHAEDATAEPTTFLATTASATATTAVGVPNFFLKRIGFKKKLNNMGGGLMCLYIMCC